jgi:hypothetical protein
MTKALPPYGLSSDFLSNYSNVTNPSPIVAGVFSGLYIIRELGWSSVMMVVSSSTVLLKSKDAKANGDCRSSRAASPLGRLVPSTG